MRELEIYHNGLLMEFHMSNDTDRLQEIVDELNNGEYAVKLIALHLDIGVERYSQLELIYKVKETHTFVIIQFSGVLSEDLIASILDIRKV